MSTCSDYFSEIFKQISCKTPVIVLKDIKTKHLEILLDYMYQGEVNVSQSELSCLIQAAECLRIKGLAVPDDNISETKPEPGSNIRKHKYNDVTKDVSKSNFKKKKLDENSYLKEQENNLIHDKELKSQNENSPKEQYLKFPSAHTDSSNKTIKERNSHVETQNILTKDKEHQIKDLELPDTVKEEPPEEDLLDLVVIKQDAEEMALSDYNQSNLNEISFSHSTEENFPQAIPGFLSESSSSLPNAEVIIYCNSF